MRQSLPFAALGLPSWFPHVELATAENGARDVLVTIFLRGGADGLSMVAPFGDASYYDGRPTIAIPRPDSRAQGRGLALDDFFMLPAALQALVPAYRAGNLLALQAVGQMATKTRSHFEAERYLEVGKPEDLSVDSGWVARHLQTSAPLLPGAPLRGIALAGGGIRYTLVGAPNTLAIPSPDNFRVNYLPDATIIDQMYATAWSPVRDSARAALATAELFKRLAFSTYKPDNGAVYPTTDLGRGLRSIAALLKAEVGLEAALLDAWGWDTHANQEPVEGAMAQSMKDLGDSVGAFWTDIMQGPLRKQVTVIVMSEFGRNARENGTRGTDHGRGGAGFVLGAGIRGGRVLTQWPGLAREQLEDGQDVRVTIDYRDIFAELVKRRLGNPNLSTIFPDYTPREYGITLV
ncbi:MAG: DUF1501 domain-containing protein [Gemmatimonadaceae bacterium]